MSESIFMIAFHNKERDRIFFYRIEPYKIAYVNTEGAIFHPELITTIKELLPHQCLGIRYSATNRCMTAVGICGFDDIPTSDRTHSNLIEQYIEFFLYHPEHIINIYNFILNAKADDKDVDIVIKLNIASSIH